MCLKQIAEGGEELLIVRLEADAGGFVEVGSVDEALEFLQHLGSHTEDWSAEGVFVVGNGGVVVADFFDNELQGAPRFVYLHAVVSHLVEDILAEIFYIICLRIYLLGGFDWMEIAIDKHLLFVEVALIEHIAVDSGLGGFHFFKSLGMDSGYGYAHASYLHDELAVAVDADDISGHISHVASGDTEQDAVASIIMEWMKEEADAFG